MPKFKYDITWQREYGSEILTCIDLTAGRLVARLRNAIRNSGPIIIHSVTKTKLLIRAIHLVALIVKRIVRLN